MEITISKKGLKKTLAVLMAMIIALSSVWTGFGVVSYALEKVGGGTFGAEGDNLNWEVSYDDYGSFGMHIDIYISGAGDMENFLSSGDVPWNSYLDDYDDAVFAVYIDEGVTSIGDNAFKKFISRVELPSSISRISESAFKKNDVGIVTFAGTRA